MQTLYQFVLPDVANDGVTDYSDARRAFEQDALRLAGGYTYLGTAVGAWQDKGRVFHERNHVYHVASDAVGAVKLTLAAFDHFPDQYAIYRAEIGKGALVERRRADVGETVDAAKLPPFAHVPPLAAMAASPTLSDL